MVDPEPERSDAIARAAVAAHGLADASLRLITVSENATYLVESPMLGEAGRAVLRVHRDGYHDRAAIESELAWLAALAGDGAVQVPAVLPAPDGDPVVAVPGVAGDRYAVLFELVPGREPDPEQDGEAGFARLGAITAALHRHSRSWRRPEGFRRFTWDLEQLHGAAPRWGRWQAGIGVGPDEHAVLAPAADLVAERLTSYGVAGERFGLVHADLRMANLLIDTGSTSVIDFDDCGFSWFGYDFGAAVSFAEDDPRLPEWQAAWVRGYREVADLDDETEAMLPTFVMLRRLLLIAWMGSHAHAREVPRLGPSYTKASLDLARTYLATKGAACSPPSPAAR